MVLSLTHTAESRIVQILKRKSLSPDLTSSDHVHYGDAFSFSTFSVAGIPVLPVR
jgi:hypothetical protein